MATLSPVSANLGAASLARPAFSAFNALQREIDRLFDNFTHAGWSPFNGGGAAVSMDVADTEDGLELTAELPGLEQQDVDISLADGVLTISGEKRSERDEMDKDYRLVERSYGAFSRSIALPADVEADKIRATMDKGILKVSIPRAARPEPTKIEVQGAV